MGTLLIQNFSSSSTRMQGTVMRTVVLVVAMVSVVVRAGPQYHPRPQPSYGAPVCEPSTVTLTNTEYQQVTVSDSCVT